MAFNTPPSLILPFLYLGSQYNAASKKQLNELRVNRILDLKERQTGNETLHELPYLAVPMSDHGDTSISEILPDCFKFIEDAKSSTEIALVHWYVSGSYGTSVPLTEMSKLIVESYYGCSGIVAA
jgi:dual specificity MAP kinase phosphatase